VELINELCKQFAAAGLRIIGTKRKVAPANTPQTVTGFLVNRKVSIPREERGRIRAAVNQLEEADPGDGLYEKAYKSVVGRVRYLRRFHPKMGSNLLERIPMLPAAK
jgi:hypothetical protein